MTYQESNIIKNICVYGVGGVGGFFGGKIAYKLNQNIEQKVFFIARGPHLESIQKKGLLLNTLEQKNMICNPSLATDNIEDIPIPDLYLICVKSYDLDKVIDSIHKKVTDNTIIIPLLNGVDVYERIKKKLNQGVVLPSCVYVGSNVENFGVVSQIGGDGIILCGKDPKSNTFVPGTIQSFFNQMEIPFKWNNDPYPAIWGKFIFIAAFGLVTAYSQKTIGEVLTDSGLKETVQKIMTEIALIARKSGVYLAEDIVMASLAKGNNFPFETKTSYQRDIESKKKLNEGDLFGGTIIRQGGIFGIQTPVTKFIYSDIQTQLA